MRNTEFPMVESETVSGELATARRLVELLERDGFQARLRRLDER